MQFRERYDIVNLLGRGTTASVYFVRDKHLDKHWAAKIFETNRFQSREWLCMENEIHILKQLCFTQMPRIVDLYRENTRTCLVMDYIEGHRLDRYVHTYGPVGETLTLQWMLELCDLIEQLHCMCPPIVYCDLKPENIVLQKNGHLALVDFGSARQILEHRESNLVLTGTRGYTAPELFADVDTLSEAKGCNVYKSLNTKADIYSIGAVGAFMLCGMYQTKWELFWEQVSKGMFQLLKACLAPPDQRIDNCDSLRQRIQRVCK